MQDTKALESAIDEIWELAKGFGLNPFPIHFEIVPAEIMYEFGAYGLPGHFTHWTHGKAYHKMKTMYDYGLSKIYELVINTDPCYAYLLETNSLLANKMIIAHVIAHCDFFRNNIYFSKTNRKMVETATAHADRIRQHEFEHGLDDVERVLDAALSIQFHTDPGILYPRRPQEIPEHLGHATPFDDLFNLGQTILDTPTRRAPAYTPDPDLLRFIIEHAPDLLDWEKDVLEIVRNETAYFMPQMRTKVTNEGWATIWHRKIMQSLDLSASEVMEFAELHSGVLAPQVTSINPYYVGSKILEDIQERCGDEKLFEVRELENDASMLRTYLTKKLVKDLDLYLFAKDGGFYVVSDTVEEWENVRDRLADVHSTFDMPIIKAVDGDFISKQCLLLEHEPSYERDAKEPLEGTPVGAEHPLVPRELDPVYAEKTTTAIARLWKRSVFLKTVRDGKSITLEVSPEDWHCHWST